MKRAAPIAGFALLVAVVFLLSGADDAREQISRYRNLGKAFYENPTTQLQAVDQFQKALALAPNSPRERVNYALALLRAGKTEQATAELEKAQKQDPKIPHTWFNLGITYKKDAKYDEAIRQFEQMTRLVPGEAVSHYNLGVLYKLTAKPDLALAQFEAAAKLNPNLAGAHFQLYNAYRSAGRTADAAGEEKIFQDLKKKKQGAAVPEDLEWSFYSEVYDVIDPAAEGAPASAPKFEARKLGTGFDKNPGVVVADVNGDGKPDLIVWSATQVRVFKSGAAKPEESGLGALRDVVSIIPGDFNNDGLPDLAVITGTGAELWVNKNGSFEKSAVALPPGPFNNAVWVDYDHDYDLDLLLLGEKSVLMRNNGASGFSNESASFPIVSGKAVAGVLYDLVPDTESLDVVVIYADRPGVLYRDKLLGKYEAQDIPAVPAGAQSVVAYDFNNDGWTDLVVGGGSGLTPIQNHDGKLKASSALAGGASAVFADVGNRGLADMVSAGCAFLNQGLGQFTKSDLPLLAQAVAIATADFDADGRADLAVVERDGTLNLLVNQTGGSSGSLRARLLGVKNLKQGYGAKVEIKAGALYQKQTYTGVPLLFGMAGRKEAETVRITWPNGMVQNQTRQASGAAVDYKEAPRLSGSCPMIFTWNGKGYEFITDVLGVAPLGASAGEGSFFPVDHDEYIQIPGDALAPREGRYEIRVSEELREVSYLDQIQLLAVDHPATTEIFTNDKFKSPPFPEFRLFGVERRIYPKSARDQHGADVLGRLTKRDHNYVDSFRRDYAGIAETHSLDLDFGSAAQRNQAVLVLNGWVDWADGSTFLSASQEKGGALITPYLQVRDASGQWRTVIEDMGLPSGKPKTIVVDLTGKFLSSSREVRIVTNLCIYWDEIFLSEDTDTPRTVITKAAPGFADLHFRGFSKPVIHPRRTEPEQFLYSEVSYEAPWNPTPGRYTRYGDVHELLDSPDDRMVVMGSGDELKLLFDARAFPPLKSGWRRDFLLLVDGWAKDADANTAFGKTVEPLPFHQMSAYPYPAHEHFPDDAVHREYRQNYNTRPALHLLRPITELRRNERGTE